MKNQENEAALLRGMLSGSRTLLFDQFIKKLDLLQVLSDQASFPPVTAST